MTTEIACANNLFQLEGSLNRLTYKKIPTGGLLSQSFTYIFKGTYKPRVINRMLVLAKFFLKSFTSSAPKGTTKKLFYYQSGDHNHYKRLQSVVSGNYKHDEFFLFGNTEKTEMQRNRSLVISLGEFIRVQLWILANSVSILNKFRKSKISFQNSLGLLFELNLQLIRTAFWDSFLKKSTNLKLLVGDYDRGQEPAVIFLCAKKHGVPTIVLQHGVVNPPYGYTPLLAAKVCVWGEMQKQQLIELGVKNNQIIVTGTPLIQKVEKADNLRHDILKRINTDVRKKNIFLAINPIKDDYNRQLIETFIQACNNLNPDLYQCWLKLHPAQNVGSYSWLKDSKIRLMSKEVNQAEFFNICDILITHNSGIANEALYYGIPVAILDILPIAGNGIELNKYFNIPLIKSAEELSDFIQREELINKIHFSKSDWLFYKTGNDAEAGILNEIRQYY